MYLEALKIFISNRHIRFTRALRPFLLLDNYLMSGVRRLEKERERERKYKNIFVFRVVRQIFICLKYIVDVMFVLFFLVAVFSLMGKYMIYM